MKTFESVFESAVAEQAESVVRAKQRLNVIKASKKALKPILTRIIDLTSATDYLSVSTNLYDSKPRMYVTLQNLNSFKDERWVRLLTVLSDHAEMFKTEEYAVSMNRDYKFSAEQYEVNVAAYVLSDSATCRKVLIGVETVQKEKYEIVCD